MPVQEKISRLVEATTALVAYIEENQVFDKLADCGCGYLDQYRTDKFDDLIGNAKHAARAVKHDLQSSG